MSKSTRGPRDLALPPELAPLKPPVAHADTGISVPKIGPPPGPGTDATHTASFDSLASLTSHGVSSIFLNGAGLLTSIGNNQSNTIEFSRNAAGVISVNGNSAIVGGPATVANTKLIQAFGLGGNDVITLNEANGALGKANLFGGAGNDSITGGSGADQLFGQDGNDQLFGKGGNDLLFGGAGNDVLTGGDGDDQMFGEAGDDRMIWNPGDDNDLMEGGSGNDTAEVNGGGGAETFSIAANGTRVRLDRVDPAPFFVDIGTTENIELNAGGGDDRISAVGNLAALVKLKIDGGAGNDTILGGNGADLLIGGDGNDFIDGNQGNDIARLGAGDDTFQWDPGDGSDVVEGDAGLDKMIFNGSNGAEIMELSANGSRTKLTRDVGNIVMDSKSVEQFEINAFGGPDSITVNDLSGTGVTKVVVDLGINGAGDGAVDQVTVIGTKASDQIEVISDTTSVSVTGLPAAVQIKNVEATDKLNIVAGAGNDRVSAATATIALAIDGGAGNDTLLGGRAADVISGGTGNDFIDGNQGNDVAFMGAGDDTFVWDPGDGSDTIEGEAGTDTMIFNGANVAERMDMSANGGRLRFFRDVGNIVMDTNDLEKVVVNARGGVDDILVGDLTGTDVKDVRVDLGLVEGQIGDGTVDRVSVFGTNDVDQIRIADRSGKIEVKGLAAVTTIVGMEANGSDHLDINGQGGADTIDASNLHAGLVTLTLNGGLGNDTFKGSQGNDLIVGGDGNDVAFMGAGDDTFVWNPGDDNDTVEGQSGFDALLFNGANVGENVALAANGGRVLFLRDVANVVMDNNDVELFHFNALGGPDHIVVNDLTGTDAQVIEIDLAAASGVGDAAADTVDVHGTQSDDVAVLVGASGSVSVLGLSATVAVTGIEWPGDTLTVDGGDGDDVIDASGVAAGTVSLILRGGAGNDVLIGGDGDDVLFGGEGDDVLIGGLGNDTIEGGPGDDIEIQGFVAGAGSEDVIDLAGRGFTFESLMAHASEVNGNTVLDLGDQLITLDGVSSANLHHDDFLLG